MKSTDISSNAMIVTLRASFWSGIKIDKLAKETIQQAFGTTGDTHTAGKRVLGDKRIPSHWAIKTVIDKARKIHKQYSLPWDHDGANLLPVKAHDKYCELMREVRQEFFDAVAKFLDEYPTLKLDAKKRLNGAWDESDYPTIEDLRGCFNIDFQIDPLPITDDFRVKDLPAGLVEKYKRDLELRQQQLLEQAQFALFERIFKVCRNMAERFNVESESVVFRDSMIRNVETLIDSLDHLDLGNTQIEEAKAKLHKLIVEPKEIRKDPELRRDLGRQAQEIQDEMAGMF